jgi:hypothetical protein
VNLVADGAEEEVEGVAVHDGHGEWAWQQAAFVKPLLTLGALLKNEAWSM